MHVHVDSPSGPDDLAQEGRARSGLSLRVEPPTLASRRLRLSLTAKCNFRCFFCHNEGQDPGDISMSTKLTVADYGRLAKAFRGAGIQSIKLTGGEPLIYKAPDGDVAAVVKVIRDAYRNDYLDLSMTTNGWYLKRSLDALASAGLKRVTVSLSSLNASTHSSLIQGRRGDPGLILESIAAAVGMGFSPVKVNMVLFDEGPSGPGNVGEIAAILESCHQAGVSELRLYPLLRTRANAEFEQRYRYWDRKTVDEVLAALLTCGLSSMIGDVASFFDDLLWGKYDRLAAGSRMELTIPVAEAMKISINLMPAGVNSGCGRCETPSECQEGVYALRLTADGKFRTCLYSPPFGDLRGCLRAETTDSQLVTEVRRAREIFESTH
jgi:cyclic pyranopterin phosphate synthase